MLIDGLGWLGRRGRALLVLGLVAGVALPTVGAAMRPWLPELIGGMIAVAAFRIGAAHALGAVREALGVLGVALAFQLAAPLALSALLAALGWAATPLAVALVLMLAAPSISGSPNLALMMGRDPAPAFRLLVVGTALFPLTAPVALASLPGIDGAAAAAAALRLLGVIGTAAAFGFAARAWLAPGLDPRRLSATDGFSALLMAVVVVGLMSSVRPMLEGDPWGFAGWLAAAFAANFGAQIAAALLLRGRGVAAWPAFGMVAGNRNIALFLVALPEPIVGPLLAFIGCYQFPMYLTPLLLRWFYRSGAAVAPAPG